MTNAEMFKRVFGVYAEEFWAYSEEKMLDWLTSDASDTDVYDLISRQAALEAIGEKPFIRIESQEDIDYEQGLQNQWQRNVDTIKLLQPYKMKG